MNENWREWLYPLGFLSGLAFGGRFLTQWISSEIHQKSLVNRTFWRLSLIGNLLLLIHAIIQIQFHIGIIQSCNAVISWRNLNLMQKTEHQISFKSVLLLFFFSLSSCILIFVFQGLFLEHSFAWFRIPATPWFNPVNHVSPFWHIIGIIGLILFNSRFWIQWWLAEKKHTSYLGASFWWVSLAGDLLSLTYFMRIVDPVNLIGPVVGFVPYIRNLMLIKKSQNASKPS